MAKKELPGGQTFRDTGRLNMLFALSSLALFAATIWMVIDDYTRDWKGWQRAFRNVELEKTLGDLEAAQAEVDQYELEQLNVAKAEAEAQLVQHEGTLDEIDDELVALGKDLYSADLAHKQYKSLLDAARYELVNAREHGDDTESYEADYQEMIVAEDEALTAVKDVRAQIAAAEQRRDDTQADLTRVETGLRDLNKQVTRFADRAAQLEPKLTERFFLDQPVVDFIAPTLKVEQVVLEQFTMDFAFSQVPRVDRCQTCHVAIDKPGFEDYPQPMQTHPRLDLYLAGNSPHPLTDYGCTVCHEGRDRGTSFSTASHTPSDDEEAARWKKEYGWKPIKHWNMPMYKTEQVEAGCYRCHSQDVYVDEADTLNYGMALMEQSGCHGCHTMERYADFRKAGPDLSKIASKVDRDWMARWIEEPRAFRPDTKMPRFYGLSNHEDAEDGPRNALEIEAMTEYLMAKSELVEFPEIRLGDVQRGEELFDTVGCRACHAAAGDGYEANDRIGRGMFGPTLTGIGSKTTPGFLYEWIRNPKKWWPETRMPSLRLTDEEARDIVAYLMTLQNDAFGQRPVPRADEAGLDQVVRDHFRLKLTSAEIDTMLAGMTRQDKLMFVGEKTIQRSGCFGCHNISGFEDAQPIGVPLDGEGSKLVHKFDFALEHDIPHTRHDWITAKLMEPRRFDHGLIKSREEKLRMPRFDFTEREANAITTAVIGMVKEEIPHEWKAIPEGPDAVIEEGRWLVKHNNCRGCHLVEGTGGELLPVVAENLTKKGESAQAAMAFAPPNLYAEGRKVKPDWFFNFLREPTPIRPWLEVRMPSFEFDNDTANTLVHYFSAADEETFPYGFDQPYPQDSTHRAAAVRLMSDEIFNCWNCHMQGTRTPEGPPSGWAPDLAMARQRLKGQWIVDWLRDPQQLMPGTTMPSFFLDENSGPPFVLDGDEQVQMEVIRDYIMNLGSGG